MNQNHDEYKRLRLHPNKIMLTLLLMGITMIFLGITMSYLYQRLVMDIPAVRLPYVFLLNALLLLGSSLTLKKAKEAYLDDDTDKYKFQLSLTLGLTLLFVVAQSYAWIWMKQNGMFPHSGQGVAYLYALAGLHVVHVCAGIPFFILFLRTAILRMREPVSVLIYFADPEKKLKLNLLSFYWHFLDGLWLYLVLFFTFIYLI